MTELARIENSGGVFTDDILANISDFETAAKIFESAGVEVENFENYGTGFKVLSRDDKARLVGVPLFLVEWRFNDGDYGKTSKDDKGGQFVSVALVTKNGEKWILNDGSTGIFAQLKMVTEQRRERGHSTPQAGLVVPNGLSRSDYEKEINGEIIPATTYYLAQ